MESIDHYILVRKIEKEVEISLFVVEGGHRAIIFNRIGGIDQHTIHAEGLHFR
jgi:hypothetical protein